MKRLLAAMGLLVSVSALAPALARTGTGHVTRCYADCPTELTGCRTVFVKGHFYRDCVRRIVYACRHAGGCGAVMPPPPTDRCRDAVFCPLGRPVCDANQLRCVRRDNCPSGYPVYCGTYCCTPGGVCGQGGCVPPPTGPPTLPPGNYNVTICVSGTISLPCTPIGTFPVSQLPAFEQAMQGAISQFLAAGGAGGCSIGAGQANAAGGGVDVSFRATCTDPSGASASETVLLEVRP
jgi:hypothetical protein